MGKRFIFAFTVITIYVVFGAALGIIALAGNNVDPNTHVFELLRTLTHTL